MTQTYRFVEHARLPVLVLALGAVDEPVAEHVVVYTPIPALSVRRGTRKSLHPVHRGWTFCGRSGKKKTFIRQVRNGFATKIPNNFSQSPLPRRINLHTILKPLPEMSFNLSKPNHIKLNSSFFFSLTVAVLPASQPETVSVSMASFCCALK